MMPDIDGYSMINYLRQDQRLASIPIILITAFDEAATSRGLELGANDFIRKPIRFDELMKKINRQLEPVQRSSTTSRFQRQSFGLKDKLNLGQPAGVD
jgi:DNA-binding response OmpR family regulator